jgi:hypothetical protein
VVSVSVAIAAGPFDWGKWARGISGPPPSRLAGRNVEVNEFHRGRLPFMAAEITLGLGVGFSGLRGRDGRVGLVGRIGGWVVLVPTAMMDLRCVGA